MTVPKDFRVDVPHDFEWQVGVAGGDFNHRNTPDGVWVEVEGGGLPLPLVVRIDRTKDGRFVITGMLMGRDDHREIDWATMRSIKPASILSMIFAGFDPKLPEKLVDDKWLDQWRTITGPVSEEDLKSGSGDWLRSRLETSDEAVEAFARAMRAHDIWRRLGGDVEAGASVTEVTRPRSSVATNLTEFADVYRRHVAANPRRATAATAEELHISRATAIRRIAECREIGLLPPKEQDRE